MTGPKQKLSPEQYARWLHMHRIAERKRLDKIKRIDREIRVLPLEERCELEETYSLEEAYWHPLSCECGSCDGRYYIKEIRLAERPIPPAVKSGATRLPELPYLQLLRLQVAEEAARSTED